jgi:excinuclease ABC subunit B
MQFKLESRFKPTGDQPQAIEALAASIATGQKHQTLLGVTGSGKTFTLANVIEKLQMPTLVISHNKTLAGQLYQEFRDFFPNNAVSYFVSYYDYYQPEAYVPSTDTYIDKEVDINDEIDKLRLAATANLISRPDVIIVASVSCIYNLGSPVEYDQFVFTIVAGELISQQSLVTRLIDLQYVRNEYEFKRGTFRIKGDVIQVWPSHADTALSIEMEGNKISSITSVDPVSLEPIKIAQEAEATYSGRVSIYPAKHNITNPINRDQAYEQIKFDLAQRLAELKAQNKIVEAFRLGQRVKHDLEMIKEVGYVNGIENYSRYFDGRKPGDPPYTLLDYFKLNAARFGKDKTNPGFLTIIDESHITLPQVKGMYFGDKARKQTLIDYGFRLPSASDNRPLMYEETNERLPQIVYVSATPTETELTLSQGNVAEQLIRPTGLLDPPVEVRPTTNQIPNLIREIMTTILKGERVLVTTLTKRTAEALTDYLNDEAKIRQAMVFAEENTNKADKPLRADFRLPKVAYLHSDIDTLERSDILDSLRMGEFDVLVGINLLREGLDLPEVTLVAILEADKEGFLRSKTSLIQTMGRAARHEHGRVILYADKHSKAMVAALEEVNRRRSVQAQYNADHGITPTSISKPVREKLLDKQEETEAQKATIKPLKNFSAMGWETIDDIEPGSLTPQDVSKLVKDLTKEMKKAAADWDFELAANYRDAIKRLEIG